jgi:hypothetical protein
MVACLRIAGFAARLLGLGSLADDVRHSISDTFSHRVPTYQLFQ